MTPAADRPMVQAGFGTPGPQGRWSIAFRVILLIPQFFVGFVYGVAAFVLIFLGWFAALFTGRMPRSFTPFISSFIQYETRVYSYLWLMNDAYPPFSLEPSRPYAVNVDIGVGPVRRMSVLFRIFILIPAAIVASLANSGMFVAGIFIWLIVLVAGRMPNSLFEAIAAVLRFQARYGAYGAMLTSKYPGEIFGDTPMAVATLPPPPPPMAPPMTAASPFDTPGIAPQGDWTISVGVPPMPPGTPAFAPPPVGPPTTSRLVLSKAGKRIVALFLVLGGMSDIASSVVQATLSSNVRAYNDLVNANSALESSIRSDQAQQATCTEGQLQCTEQYQNEVGSAFAAFGTALNEISFPSSSQSEVTALSQDTVALVAFLRQLSSSTSLDSLNSQLPHLEDLANQWDSDETALAATLT